MYMFPTSLPPDTRDEKGPTSLQSRQCWARAKSCLRWKPRLTCSRTKIGCRMSSWAAGQSLIGFYQAVPGQLINKYYSAKGGKESFFWINSMAPRNSCERSSFVTHDWLPWLNHERHSSVSNAFIPMGHEGDAATQRFARRKQTMIWPYGSVPGPKCFKGWFPSSPVLITCATKKKAGVVLENKLAPGLHANNGPMDSDIMGPGPFFSTGHLHIADLNI